MVVSFSPASPLRFDAKAEKEIAMQDDVSRIHDRVIETWLLIKESKPEIDNRTLAYGVFFAITDQQWPDSLPVGDTAMDVCAAVNRHLQLPDLTADDMQAIAVRAATARVETVKMAKIFVFYRLLKIAVVLLALATTFIVGVNWNVLGAAGLVFGTAGVSRAAGVMHQNGHGTGAAVMFWSLAHIAAIVAAFVFPAWLLVKHFA